MSEQLNEQLENKAEVFEVDTDQLFKNKPEFHTWIQRGPFLVCTSCQFVHQVYIGTRKILIGIDESNKPILRDKAS